MVNKLKERIAGAREWLLARPLMAFWLAGAGALAYLAQSYRYLFTLRSILDEGLYLVKGYYYALGIYAPFQDYGFLTNHMPLSFVIPGWVQATFGPGLATGRWYAFVLGALALGGLWLAAHRVGGRWWAAAAVWAIALNPALVKAYSVAFSQVLVAALVAWTLALALGRGQPIWQSMLAGVLAGVTVMVRINMAPLLALLVLYTFWQHGRRAGLALTLSALAALAAVHAAYWPGILRLWAYWIPEGILPFLEPFYSPWRKYETFVASPFSWWIRHLDDPMWDMFQAAADGLAFNFLVVAGVAANLLLWPRRGDWSERAFKLAVFLNVAYVSLFSIHAWAALSGNSCTFFCFSGYLAFFSGIGLLALVATAPYWRRAPAGWRRAALLALFIVLGLMLGHAAADQIGLALAELPLPRPGAEPLPLWGPLQAKFGWSLDDSRVILPSLLGLSLGGLLALGAGWRSRQRADGSAVYAALVALLVISLVLGPTVLFGGGDQTLDCGSDVVANYAAAGEDLAALLPADATVYYDAANSPIILLYLGGIGIYPPQMNNVFSFADIGGAQVNDELLRFGYWNADWAAQWRAEADFVLVEGRHYADWQADIEAGRYDIRYVSDPIETCRGKDSEIVLLEARP
jgi:hypothetical protein